MSGQDIDVVCVCTGQKYADEYVRKLHNSVAMHAPSSFRFFVLTEHDMPKYNTIKPPKGVKGYWNKLALFDPKFIDRESRVLYFDLDILIRGPLDALFEATQPFIMARDGIYAHRYNSSVMAWSVCGATEEIWREWNESGRPLARALQDSKGDQAWIESMLLRTGHPVAAWQDIAPGVVVPYYGPGTNPQDPTKWTKLEEPGNASVVIFHGKPRLDELATTIPWVKEAWR